MLFTEMVQQLRVMLGDFEEVDDFGEMITPPQYPDDRLSSLLAISIRQVQTQLRIPKEYRLEPMAEMPYIDPWYDICDDFAYLLILKALCILQKRGIQSQYEIGNVKTKLGPAELSTGNATWSGMPKHIWEQTSPCAEYEKALMTWITFDPRKLQAVYAILPIGGGGTRGNNRGQLGEDPSHSMIQ
jgi:hypothetical protein